QQPAYSDLPRDPSYRRRAKRRRQTDNLSAQSSASYAPALDRRNGGYSGASPARCCAGYWRRLWGEDAPLPGGAAVQLFGPRAEMSGQMVGIAIGKSSSN